MFIFASRQTLNKFEIFDEPSSMNIVLVKCSKKSNQLRPTISVTKSDFFFQREIRIKLKFHNEALKPSSKFSHSLMNGFYPTLYINRNDLSSFVCGERIAKLS